MSSLLLDAFKLAPKQAIDFFRKKGFKATWNWQDADARAHESAFTVAKAMRLDILQTIRDAVNDSLTSGRSFSDFLNELEPLLQKQGWWGKAADPNAPGETVQLGSVRRLRTIHDTNMQSAYGEGRWRQLQTVKKSRPYAQYTAVLDGATRPAHRALHGKVFRLDDPQLQTIAPPNGFRCRCTLVSVSSRDVEREQLDVEQKLKPVSREVLVTQKTGELKTVNGVQLGDKSQFYPDYSFDRSPRQTWKPDLQRYDADLVQAYDKAKPKKRGKR